MVHHNDYVYYSKTVDVLEAEVSGGILIDVPDQQTRPGGHQGHGGWCGALKHRHRTSNGGLSSDLSLISYSTSLIFDPKVT